MNAECNQRPEGDTNNQFISGKSIDIKEQHAPNK